ncbi:MAG: apolipoprotein N-acyltransferase [Rhodobacteraceae bacterium]|nr:apolipoprotein N-acyltransferase [Paracoccaceae bacterium]
MKQIGKWRRFGLSLLAGLALALGQAPMDFPWLAILALPGLLYLLRMTCCWKGGFLVGWGAGLGYFGLSLSWIVEPFLVDADRYGWMAPFALVLMAGGMALFWGLGFALARRWPNAVVFAGFWTLAELLRSYIFTGFPWALQAYSWVETPVIQAASVIGVHGLGFLIVLAGGLLLSRRGAVVAVVIVGVLTSFGLWRLQNPVIDTALTVRLVQPNAIQAQKWDPDYYPMFYQRQLDYSAAPGAPDIVIWPEVSIVYLPGEQPEVREDIAMAAQAPVLVGARRRDGQDIYNSLFLIDKESRVEAVYDKYHLVPFGEYMPLQSLADKWGLKGLAEVMGGGISAGTGPKLLSGKGVPAFLPLICYEAIFPQGVAGLRPEWLVQVTNDAWFGEAFGPYQHFNQSRVRAIEQGLPLARAANTGISAMVDPYGRIVASIPLGQDGFVDAVLPAPLTPTVLARIGQWPVITLIVLLLLGGIIGQRRGVFRPL